MTSCANSSGNIQYQMFKVLMKRETKVKLILFVNESKGREGTSITLATECLNVQWPACSVLMGSKHAIQPSSTKQKVLSVMDRQGLGGLGWGFKEHELVTTVKAKWAAKWGACIISFQHQSLRYLCKQR